MKRLLVGLVVATAVSCDCNGGGNPGGGDAAGAGDAGSTGGDDTVAGDTRVGDTLTVGDTHGGDQTVGDQSAGDTITGDGAVGDSLTGDAGTGDTGALCNDFGGQIFQLTTDPADDEDGSIVVDDNGRIHFVFISNRAGTVDVWITDSMDGRTWSTPRIAVQTAEDDLLNNLTRTRDGMYHLTGRTLFEVADSTSADLITWTSPTQWTDPGVLGWTAGYFQESAPGNYWMMSLSNRSGTRKLYRQMSVDSGASWSMPPVEMTRHTEIDGLFAYRIASDGTHILVWEQWAVGDGIGFSGDIYLSLSLDGAAWSPPELLSPSLGADDELDIWPSLLEGSGGQWYAQWVTSRLAPARFPAVVAVPVYPRPAVRPMLDLPANGYSARSQELPDGRFLLAWVQTDTTLDTPDYYYRFLCDFDLDRIPPTTSPDPFMQLEPTLPTNIVPGNASGQDEDPTALIAADGSMYAAWYSNRLGLHPSGRERKEVVISRSTDGDTFTTPVAVTDDAEWSFYPTLAQDGSDVFHMAWMRWYLLPAGCVPPACTGLDKRIMVNSSTNGLTWNTATELEIAGGPVDEVPSIVATSDGRLLVYYQSGWRAGDTVRQIFVVEHDGTSWGAPAPVAAVSSGTDHDTFPHVVQRASDDFMMTWTRYDLSFEDNIFNTSTKTMLSTSTDGLVWTTPVALNTAGTSVNVFPYVYPSHDRAQWFVIWATDTGIVDFPVGGTYPDDLVPLNLVGYTHRMAPTATPGIYWAVWAEGTRPTEKIRRRLFAK